MNSMPPPDTMKVLNWWARSKRQQLEHRLVDEIGVGPVEARMARGREPVEHRPGELLRRHAGMGGRDDFQQPFSPSAASAARSSASTAWNGSCVRHSGWRPASAFTRSNAKTRPGNRSAARSTGCRHCRSRRCAPAPAPSRGRPSSWCARRNRGSTASPARRSRRAAASACARAGQVVRGAMTAAAAMPFIKQSGVSSRLALDRRRRRSRCDAAGGFALSAEPA